MDWYNNAGGQGIISLDLSGEKLVVRVDMGINVHDTEDHVFSYKQEDEDEENDKDVFYPHNAT